jgi:hypothetical protein
MKNKKIIIGKNSWVVKKIKNELKDFDFISHKEVKDTNLKMYEHVFLFSWSSDKNENKSLIKILPKKKLIFISSIGTYACLFRPQWNKYVNDKKYFEDILNKQGVVIVRLGIFQNMIRKHHKAVPYTSFKTLSLFLNEYKKTNCLIYDVYELQNIHGTSFLFSSLIDLLHMLSSFFTSVKFIRIAIEAIVKYLFRSPSYGYTRDALNYYYDTIQIGFGAIGSKFYRSKKKNSLIIVSGNNNILLNNNGFVGTLIGYMKIGLSSFWHGAFLVEDEGNIRKKVPFIVRRNKPPLGYKIGHVSSIYRYNNFYKITLDNGKYKNYFFSKKLVLSAGAIENIRFLSQISLTSKNKFFFSDQEWVVFGKISLKEAVKFEHILKYGPLIFRNNLLHINNKLCNESLIEFRPIIKNYNDMRDFKFYSDTTSNILIKIFKKLSYERINEAIFNKFGFSFLTNSILVIGQVSNLKSISFSLPNNLKRKRVNIKNLNKIRKVLQKKYTSFESSGLNKSFDSQHLSSDYKLLKNKRLSELLKKKKLKVLGNSSNLGINKFYPTKYSSKSEI